MWKERCKGKKGEEGLWEKGILIDIMTSISCFIELRDAFNLSKLISFEFNNDTQEVEKVICQKELDNSQWPFYIIAFPNDVSRI